VRDRTRAHVTMPLAPLSVTATAAVNALGRGRAAILTALQQRRGGLAPCGADIAELATFIGRVAGIEKESVAEPWRAFDCRNNRLAQLALRQDGFERAVESARRRYGAGRIAVLIGTSTSGVHETERAYRERDPRTGALPAIFSYRHTQDVFSVGDFVRHYLALTGPAFVISTACSSSAKTFAAAHRLLQLGLCDAAVVGGVDSLCGTTLYGFASLELVAPSPCRPGDRQRDGISIGEGAGFALLERPGAGAGSGIALLGYGESSDAYHMSSPHPDGAGAELAMAQALHSAGLVARDIDYINLHGTASRINDAVEDRAVARLFGADTPCSSTKGWTGHTLGAAGIIEAVISCLCLEHGFTPGSLNTTQVDPSFASRVIVENEARPVTRVLTNSFGFGGSNCSLVFGRT